MDSLDQVRTTIKRWEADFRQNNQREPTLDDVRQDKSIERVYKQYRQLKKGTKPAQPQETAPSTTFNPFSPSKAKAKPAYTLNAPTTPFSRAKKRLRGEPVSPSPNKEKRRRITVEPERDSRLSSEDETEDWSQFPDDCFLGASPLKTGTFKSLFEDSSRLVGPLDFSRASKTAQKPRVSAKEPAVPRFHLKSDLFASRPTISQAQSTASSSRVSSEPNSDRDPDEDEIFLAQPEPATATRPTRQRLLCPSPPPPPPPGTTAGPSRTVTKKKDTAKPRGADSKGKDVRGDGPDDEDGDYFDQVKLYNPRFPHALEDESEDEILRGSFGRVALEDLATHVPAPEEGQILEMAVPNALREVLSLQADDFETETLLRERVYRGLVYGTREDHYDGARGGEIWDVGEDDQDAIGDEDDWEGEPIPWQVGEL